MQLLSTLKATSEKNFDRALTLAKELRRTYVGVKRPERGPRRAAGGRGVSPRVLAATSAISA
jgi:hypothetical protein